MRKFKKEILRSSDVVSTTTTTTTIPPTTTTTTSSTTTTTTSTTTTSTTTTVPIIYYKLNSCNILFGPIYTSIPPAITNQQYVDYTTNVRYYWDGTTTLTPGMVGTSLQLVSGYSNCVIPSTTTTTTAPPPMKLQVQLCGGVTTYYISVTNQVLTNGQVIKLQKSGTPFDGTQCWEVIDNNTYHVLDYNLVNVLTISLDCIACSGTVPTTTTTSTTTTTTCSPSTYYELAECSPGTGYAFTKIVPNLGVGQRYVLPSTIVYYTYTGNSSTQCNPAPPTLNESIQKTSFTGCPAPPTTTTTTTTASGVNFSFTSTCSAGSSTLTADLFTGGSGTYEMSNGLYNSEVNAYTGVFVDAVQPKNFYGVSNGTWWFAIRDKFNTGNAIAKSVTFNCTVPTTTSTTTTTTIGYNYYLTSQYSCGNCTTPVATNVLVKFPIGTSVLTNRFYLENTYSSYVYQITDIDQPAGVAILLKTPSYSTCSGACAITTTTTTTTTSAPTTTSTTTTTTLAILTASGAPSCPGTCNGTGRIIITGSGGTGVYQYSIDGGATFGASNTFSSLTNGTYYIAVKDSNGTVASNTVTVSCTSTAANWQPIAEYECVGCNRYQLEQDINSCSTTYLTKRRGTTYTINDPACGSWDLVYYCVGTTKYSKEVNYCTSEERNVTLVETNSTYCGYYTPLPSFGISAGVGDLGFACTRVVNLTAYCLGGNPTFGTVVRTTDNPASTPLAAGFYHINVTGDEYIELNSSGVVIDRGAC